VQSIVDAAQGGLERMFTLVRLARERSRARRELLGLSDYVLRDIGLHRSQIDLLFR
jgi:uncharacterized protein YjiS (DUF1127 family)